MKTFLAFLCCLIATASGELVLWTASGAITSTSGEFEDPDLVVETPVDIRMTYDDSAPPDPPFNQSFGRISTDYRQDINLTIRITIDGFVWEGFVETGFGGVPNPITGAFPPPYTVVTDLRDASRIDSFTSLLHDGDGASFSRFPFHTEQPLLQLQLFFQGSNAFLDGGLASIAIREQFINVASGFIRMDDPTNKSTSLLEFSIDPATMAVIDLEDEPFSPEITFLVSDVDVNLGWQSDSRFTYRIERSTNLSSWTEVETVNGTGAILSRSYSRSGSTEYYRIVTAAKSS
ncbi:MAG: hypothetical protein ACON5N_16950 [Akkermansiaceae bacterium]